MKPQAARNVKTGLVLDAVAKAEGIEVADEDITAAIQQMAAAARTDPEALEKSLRESERLDPIKWQVLREKAADFIAAQAVPVAPPAQPEPEAEVAEEAPAARRAEPAASRRPRKRPRPRLQKRRSRLRMTSRSRSDE